MASDPALVGLLIGLGLTEFSMTPGAIPLVGHVVARAARRRCAAARRQALRLATAAEVEQFLFDALAASVGTVAEPTLNAALAMETETV